MTRITASEARRRWFELLDRAAAGEVMVIERHGQRVVLRREESPPATAHPPTYGDVIRPLDDVNQADDWSWEWAEEGELRPN